MEKIAEHFVDTTSKGDFYATDTSNINAPARVIENEEAFKDELGIVYSLAITENIIHCGYALFLK